MTSSILLRGAHKAITFCQRLRRDARGVAAVEFGLIAPVLLIMMVGVIEATRAVSIDRRFGQVTSLVADLIAREENISSADITSIYGIVDHVMGVWGTDTLKLEIIPVQAHPSDAAIRKVYAATSNRPSYGGAAQKAQCADYSTLSADLMAQGTSVIVVESKFTFTPLFVDSFIPSQVWEDKATLTPRNSCVDFDNNNCVTACFN